MSFLWGTWNIQLKRLCNVSIGNIYQFFFNPVSANIFTLDTLEIQYYRNITTPNLLNARDVNRYWIQMKNNGPARHPNSLCDGNIRVSNTLACLRSNSIYFVFRFATPRLRGDFKFKVPGPCPGPKQIQLSFRNLQLKKKKQKKTPITRGRSILSCSLLSARRIFKPAAQFPRLHKTRATGAVSSPNPRSER